MVRLIRASVFFGLVLAWVPVWAMPLVGSDEALGMLKRLQGEWRRDCVQSDARPGKLFERTRLIVSFTHFSWVVEHFADERCTQSRGQRSARYTYRLGPADVQPDGKLAYAIDFIPVDEVSLMPGLHPLNLIRVDQGHLWLGLKPSLDEQTRAERLDLSRFYARR